MRLLGKILLMLSLGLVVATASASSTNPENGKEYKVLARPQPAEMGKKVEVIEFFGYFCPKIHSYYVQTVPFPPYFPLLPFRPTNEHLLY